MARCNNHLAYREWFNANCILVTTNRWYFLAYWGKLNWYVRAKQRKRNGVDDSSICIIATKQNRHPIELNILTLRWFHCSSRNEFDLEWLVINLIFGFMETQPNCMFDNVVFIKHVSLFINNSVLRSYQNGNDCLLMKLKQIDCRCCVIVGR